MIEQKNEEIKNKERYEEIIQKVFPHTEYMFHQFKLMGGKLPAELCYGMVCGYLHGKGFTWEESFAGMNKYIQVIESLIKPELMQQGTFTVKGNEDGSVKTELK